MKMKQITKNSFSSDVQSVYDNGNVGIEGRGFDNE